MYNNILDVIRNKSWTRSGFKMINGLYGEECAICGVDVRGGGSAK